MPTGLFDITDRVEVLQPQEVESIYKLEVERLSPTDRFWRTKMDGWKRQAAGRWNRLVATANLIDAIRGQE